MLSFTVSFFITMLNFALLFFILRRFLWKPVRRMLEERGSKLKSDLADAAFSKGRAEEIKKQYEGRLATAETDADRILEEAIDLADEESKAEIAKARTEAEAIRARAEVAAERERSASLEALTAEIARLATAAAARLAAREPGSADAAAAEALIRELRGQRGR